MSAIFISFLGIGQYNKEKNEYTGYTPVEYEFNGKKAKKTSFVQVADIELLGPDLFDRVIILHTKTSFKNQYSGIEKEIYDIGIIKDKLFPVEITEEMSSDAQWGWFETVLGLVNNGDDLTIDFTHGFRSIPIVLSAAINFLMRAKQITIQHVLYGDLSSKKIIDMRNFYVINELAEAVSRLVEDADARMIARVAEQENIPLKGLNDKALIKALHDLTDCIRNVDVNNIASKVRNALQIVAEKEKVSQSTEKLLLKHVVDKFTSISTENSSSGRYDIAYFQMQLNIIKVLLEHRLFMQAFTAMRELVGSIGMLGAPEKNKNNMFNDDGRSKGRRYANIFIRMVEHEKNEWKFTDKENEDCIKILLPYYEKIAAKGVVAELENFVKELLKYRNGFDHAWVSVNKGAYYDIEVRGKDFVENLEKVIEKLKIENIIN